MIENGKIKFIYKSTDEMIADILTKATSKSIYDKLRPSLLGFSEDDKVKMAMSIFTKMFTTRKGVGKPGTL